MHGISTSQQSVISHNDDVHAHDKAHDVNAAHDDDDDRHGDDANHVPDDDSDSDSHAMRSPCTKSWVTTDAQETKASTPNYSRNCTGKLSIS